MRILTFDIETIPDLAQARQLYHLEALSDEETFFAIKQLRREKVGHDFMPHYLQRIVAISLVLLDEQQYRVWSLGDLTSEEPELIQRFYAGLDKFQPTLVSWNGSGFDLPVLHYRALIHGVNAPTYWETGGHDSAFKWNNYLNRYHERHLDLMDVLAAYQNKAYAPLDEIASLIGLPGKMGMHGSKVLESYQQGDLAGIRDYCETDVMNTFCIYLRFELMRGQLSQEAYQTHLSAFANYLSQDSKKLHWKAFANHLHHSYKLKTPC